MPQQNQVNCATCFMQIDGFIEITAKLCLDCMHPLAKDWCKLCVGASLCAYHEELQAKPQLYNIIYNLCKSPSKLMSEECFARCRWCWTRVLLKDLKDFICIICRAGTSSSSIDPWVTVQPKLSTLPTEPDLNIPVIRNLKGKELEFNGFNEVPRNS